MAGKGAQNTIEVNATVVRTEMLRRGLTAEQLAQRAGIHVNTVTNLLTGRANRVVVETARRIALVFETVAPMHGIDLISAFAPPELRQPPPSSNGTLRPLGFPLLIDPLVRQTLREDDPLLVAEKAWFALTPERQHEFARRSAALRIGDFSHAREHDLSDIEAFLIEQRSPGINIDRERAFARQAVNGRSTRRERREAASP